MLCTRITTQEQTDKDPKMKQSSQLQPEGTMEQTSTSLGISSTPPPSTSKQTTVPFLAPSQVLGLRVCEKSIKEASMKRKEHQSFGGKVPLKHLREKVPLTEEDARRCPQRYHPGTMTLREKLKYQRFTDLLIRRAPFYCLVREITQHHIACGQILRFHVDGMAVSQEAA